MFNSLTILIWKIILLYCELNLELSIDYIHTCVRTIELTQPSLIGNILLAIDMAIDIAGRSKNN